MSNKVDAILIPGGGLNANGEIPLWVKSRLDLAAQLYFKRKATYIITLSAGTVHKPPPIRANGFPIFEAEAAAEYLVNLGVTPQNILCECSSYDTIGNAFFSRIIHVENLNCKKLLIVTSEFHMPRAKAIFQWIYGLTRETVKNTKLNYQLQFQTVPDIDDKLNKEASTARKYKEKLGLERISKFKKSIQTIESFHQWLFSRHGAYAVSVEPIRLTGTITDTY